MPEVEKKEERVSADFYMDSRNVPISSRLSVDSSPTSSYIQTYLDVFTHPELMLLIHKRLSIALPNGLQHYHTEDDRCLLFDQAMLCHVQILVTR